MGGRTRACWLQAAAQWRLMPTWTASHCCSTSRQVPLACWVPGCARDGRCGAAIVCLSYFHAQRLTQPTVCKPQSCLQGRPLLAAKSAPSDAQGYVHVPLVGGTAQLPELSVTGEQGGSPPACAAGKERCCSAPLFQAGPSSNLRVSFPRSVCPRRQQRGAALWPAPALCTAGQPIAGWRGGGGGGACHWHPSPGVGRVCGELGRGWASGRVASMDPNPNCGRANNAAGHASNQRQGRARAAAQLPPLPPPQHTAHLPLTGGHAARALRQQEGGALAGRPCVQAQLCGQRHTGA